MKISVFGLGYVGTVTAVCFAKLGHEVIGVDINDKKIAKLNSGEAPIKEEGLDNLLKEVVSNKKFMATINVSFAVKNTDVSFICVRTPLEKDEDLDISEIENVCKNIAQALINKKGKKHLVIIRSTIPPGTIDRLEKVFSEKNLLINKDFVLASNPEFLREGTAVKDFFEPPYVVIGSDNKEVLDIVESFYSEIKTKIYRVSTKTAELIKFINNSWHALEICFVNEISGICKKLGINSKELIDLFASDTKLNLSDYYLKPNMGYGGSCLPKDLGALQRIGMKNGVYCDVLNSVSKSNTHQINRVYDFIKTEATKNKKKDIGIFGIAFKPGTDDLRGSPILYIIEKLKQEGFNVKIYDPLIKKEQIDNIKNSYREVIYDPLLSELMEIKNFKSLLDSIEKMLCPLEEVLNCSTIVMNAKMPQDILRKLNSGQVLMNTRAIIQVDNKKEIKAKYVEVW